MKMMKTNSVVTLIFLVCLLSGVYSLSSCRDANMFDPEAYAQMLTDSFPVKNIDPNQTWQTVGTATANVAVNKTYGEMYTIKVYDKDPIFNSSAILLARKDSVVSGNTWTGTIDYPLADSVLFVTCVDKNARREVIPVKVKNEAISVSFGTATASTKTRAVATRASGDQYPISTMSAPYSTSDINGMLAKATEANDVSIVNGGHDIGNKGTNAYNYYKITGTFGDALVDDSPKSGTKVIVSGTWNVPANFTIQGGLEVIVASGGKIVLPSGVSIYSSSSAGVITVLNGGNISGNGQINIQTYNNLLYNGGNINVSKIYFSSYGGELYNADGASLSLSVLTLDSSAKLINQSSDCTIGDMDNYNSIVYNACRMTVTGTLNSNLIIIGSSASLQCKNLYASGSIDLNPNAILDVTNYSILRGVSITGPTDGTNYAICMLGNILSQDSNSVTSWGSSVSNYVYVDVVSYPNTSWWGGYFYSNVSNHAVWVDPGCAPLTISTSDCTIGYTPKGTGGDTGNDTNFSMIYTFEDNYPQAGDYDFNDVTLSVSKTKISNTSVQLQFTLLAVGANQQNGAALRIKGIKAGDVKSSKWSSYGFSSSGKLADGNWGLGTGRVSLFTTPSYKGVLDNTCATSSDQEVVAPLFNDAHYALLGTQTAYKTRYTYNTVVGGFYSAPKSATLLITTNSKSAADSITAKNLDVFITYNKNNINTHLEVHTYLWKTDATANGYVFPEEEAALSGKAIWAICVPSTFKYPAEFVGIEKAYPYFQNWASNMSVYKNWYENYYSNKVYSH